MNLKNRIILEEYREYKQQFIELGNIVAELLKNIVNENHIEVLAVEHRVKTEKSLSGKLELKGDKYTSLDDITDILGARIICYFSDDVDKIAEKIKEYFNIDWENSVDKRAQLKPDAFGYLSLHYICSLPDDGNYPKYLCDKRFEIQIRSILQHTWAAINHDLGYKSDFGVPTRITRDFSRIAGLLEIADKEFIEIRENINTYSNEIRNKIANNEANSIFIDNVSLNEYVKHNKQMRKFLFDIASICNAEIRDISPEVYIEQLIWLNIKTLGELQDMLSRNSELAYKLAYYTLSKTDLDILSSNVGLRYLCRAELLLNHYSVEDMEKFVEIAIGDSNRAKQQVKHLLDVYDKIKG